MDRCEGKKETLNQKKEDQRYTVITGKLGKDEFIGIKDSSEYIPVPKPKPQKYKAWQADHVHDLGLYTIIAKGVPPDFTTDWAKVKDIISGNDGVS